MNLLSVLLIAGIGCEQPARVACTCVPRPELRTVSDARAYLQNHEGALFTGLVVCRSVRADSMRVESAAEGARWWRMHILVARMQVGSQLKGTTDTVVTVETPVDPATCGADLLEGETYLVDAWVKSNGIFETSKCTITATVAEAAAMLTLLRQAIRP